MCTVFFQTFGCKVNQAETASLSNEFCQRGYEIVNNVCDADVIFINTCTVTHRSDAKCRHTIRKFNKINPQATIIVAGCYAQVSWKDISTIKGVDYILGVQDKFKLFDYFRKPGKKNPPVIIVHPIETVTETESKEGYFPNRTRALVKIQDGCNQMCSYCIVPFTRGRARSVSDDEVIHQFKNLIIQGYKEIVLTGVHIGKYGEERKEKDSLATLLEKIIKIPHLGRIRLSSIDSVDITDRLISTVADSDKICNHFHIPLQSGSDKILKLMNRPYTVKEYLDTIEAIVSKFDTIGLGTDIITGFPGESKNDFKNTFELITEVPFTYLHVFPFSLRKLTKAYSMKKKIDPAVTLKRAKTLRKLGSEKKEHFFSQWIGETIKVLFESRNINGTIKGLSSEYIPVRVKFQDELINSFALVKIRKMKNNYLTGTITKKYNNKN